MRPLPLFFASLICLGLAACAQTATRPEPTQSPSPSIAAPAPKVCDVCGVVTKIETLTTAAASAPTKPVLGGIVGGVVSAPQSKPATASTSYRIHVRLDDGSPTSVVQTSLSANLRVGSRVLVRDGRMTLLR